MTEEKKKKRICRFCKELVKITGDRSFGMDREGYYHFDCKFGKDEEDEDND